MVLDFELKISHLVGRPSTTWVATPVLYTILTKHDKM
jgi:hypothetical protein